ncbi:DNA polymerase B [Virgibacillus sp. C22-A2]|uniref:DNA polymerase B n=1 Tax=Virgibacillus tibetensis TaxID=3042313 RepID=A0ABU6KCX9_9BACI|nr:DNA polymerase B [Virgibacillus sp. C22-A2]
MFTFYKAETTEDSWNIYFNQDGKTTKLHNDKEGLTALLSGVSYLVGYGNFNYDDKILASILKGINPYKTVEKIKEGKNVRLTINNPITLDVSQELKQVELQEAKLNINSQLADVDFIKELFEKRESYFASKFEIVKEFKLPAASVKKTRANLASEVLEAKPSDDNKRLHITYDERLPKHELPGTVVDFYKGIEKEYKSGIPFKNLEERKLTYKLAGIDHIYGFGGLHAAKENYKGEGEYMQIDIASYYPSLIINNHFIDHMDNFKKIYHQRQQFKLEKNPKEEIYKTLNSSVYGAMKSKWNKLYNPRMANNIVINGQLIITHLICLLENHCEIIQTNTDGIIINYKNGFERNIIKLLELFEKAYDLKFDVDLITKIAQRDVNNYVLQYQDGRYKAKGRFSNYEGGDFERNSLTIIDKALVDYYMSGTKVNKTVIDLWKKGKLEYFQYVAKSGKYDGMAQEVKQDTLLEGNYASEFERLPDVNRIFATKDRYMGSVYKTRDDKETKYSKVPYTSENSLVWNEDIKKLDKRKLDLNWYIKQIESYMF